MICAWEFVRQLNLVLKLPLHSLYSYFWMSSRPFDKSALVSYHLGVSFELEPGRASLQNKTILGLSPLYFQGVHFHLALSELLSFH